MYFVYLCWKSSDITPNQVTLYCVNQSGTTQCWSPIEAATRTIIKAPVLHHRRHPNHHCGRSSVGYFRHQRTMYTVYSWNLKVRIPFLSKGFPITENQCKCQASDQILWYIKHNLRLPQPFICPCDLSPDKIKRNRRLWCLPGSMSRSSDTLMGWLLLFPKFSQKYIDNFDNDYDRPVWKFWSLC